MLDVTTAACEHLSSILTEAEAPEDVALRLAPADKGLALVADRPRPGDASIDHDGRTVLLLDASVSAALADRTLDIRETEEGPSLAIT